MKTNHPTGWKPGLPDLFQIWIDGVGGYRVCAGNVNNIGQAVPYSRVTIPLRGDINLNHVSIESVDGRHLLQPSGAVTIEGAPVEPSTLLRSGDCLQLGELVQLTYRQPHPLSATAVIDFTSRHRTFPWSDAVLLADDTILMGADPHNHIVCPRWSATVTLFRRDQIWFCRSSSPLEMDGTQVDGEAPIAAGSYLASEEFSFSIEGLTSLDDTPCEAIEE